MENHAPGDVLEGGLQSPRSPVPSSYGGSDAEDNDVGNLESLDAFENDTTGEMHQEPNEANPDEMDQDEGSDLAEEETNEEQNDGENNSQQEETNKEANETAAPSPSNVGNDVPAAVAGQSASQTTTTTASGSRYKYKYPEAYPTPEGWDDERWNKAYTAADSRIYNHNGKKADISRLKRKEGLTRIEALRWEEQKPEREAKKAKKSTTASQQTTSPAPALYSTPATSSASKSSASTDMGNKRIQKKRKAPAPAPALVPASVPVANSFSQVPSPLVAALPQDLLPFASTQTLADRIKGKSAASAAASTYPVESVTPVRAESEKASQIKKIGVGPVKKQPIATNYLQTPPVAKTHGVSKISGLKARGSKSGTPASTPNDIYVGAELEQFSDDEADGDETATYCVCNGPESTYMISCDSCEGWFHRRVSCLGEGNVALFKELADHIDHWYCPPCKKNTPSLAVTWYRTCRRERCNKRARVDAETPSKYCSDECAVKFFEEKIAKAPKGPDPSRGGALTQSELAMLLNSTSSAAEFKMLGKAAPKLRANGKIVPKQHLRNMVTSGLTYTTNEGLCGEDGGKVFENKVEYKGHREELDEATERRGLEIARQQTYELYNRKYDGPPLSEADLCSSIIKALGPEDGITNKSYLEIDWDFLQMHGHINPSEAQTINELQVQMKYNADWIGIASLKDSFMKALHKHVEEILASKGMDCKTVCGYLPQISMSDFEFKAWAYSKEGAKICGTGKYEPLDPGQADAWRKKSEATMCMHSAKKHATHHRWYEVHERENKHRTGQLLREFNLMLKELQQLMMVIENRIYTGEE